MIFSLRISQVRYGLQALAAEALRRELLLPTGPLFLPTDVGQFFLVFCSQVGHGLQAPAAEALESSSMQGLNKRLDSLESAAKDKLVEQVSLPVPGCSLHRQHWQLLVL